MNSLCECKNPGFCNRHQMEKNEIAYKLCKGTAATADCGMMYWRAWEVGKCGATAPANPQLNPEPFCDRSVASGIVPCEGCGKSVATPSLGARMMTAGVAAARFIGDGMKVTSVEEQANRTEICNKCPLNDNGTCKGCGCNLSLKIQARLETCPAYKWFPDIRETRPIANPVCNLLMHIFPIKSSDMWKLNLREISKRQHLFNGRKVLSIAIDERETVNGRISQTTTADEVINFSRYVGLDWDLVEAFPNEENLGEVSTFRWKLEQIRTPDPNNVTFYCHSKGATHIDNDNITRWAKMMYHTCLDDWETTKRTLERFSMAGAFRKSGEFNIGNNWHYSGTFYWFRHDDVFRGDKWKEVDQVYYGTEIWPGRMFKLHEVACLFADESPSAYLKTSWDALENAIKIYEESRE